MKWKFLAKFREEGLLILRIGIGAMFIYHGLPKLIAGPDKWQQLGSAMGYLGIDVVPQFWGFLAGFTEAVGGLCLMFGIFFRPACFALTCTMIVAATMHLGKGDGLLRASHAIEAGIMFISLMLIGPGRYSIDK
jgi:putative oxidoreductase